MEIPEHPWAQTADEIAGSLQVSLERGLTEEEVEARRRRFGRNQLQVRRRRGIPQILWNQLESLIVLLLVAATVISLVFGHFAEAVAIGVVLVVNTAIGFWMELRAVRSMESLRRMGQAGARVRRGGATGSAHADELVPGDVVALEEGDVVTADMRLVEAKGLRVDESSLTGESVAVDKGTEPLDVDVPLAERTCMVYRGTTVRRGSASGVVTATGTRSELGEISSMLSEEEDASPLDERLDRLGRKLVWLTLGVAGAVVLVGVVAGRDIFIMVQTGIALAVAAIPEGLTIVATVALARGMKQMMRKNALIRRLSAVETLGSATVICTDKTGTLTSNRMTVRHMVGPPGSVGFGRDGQRGQEDGSLRLQAPNGASTIDPREEDSPLRALYVAAVLANDAEPATDEEGPRADGGSADRGDPMDLALLVLARDLELSAGELRKTRPQVRIVPFDTDTKMMATVQEEDGGYRLCVKGATEAVLDASERAVGAGQDDEPVDGSFRDEWLRRSEDLAAEGFRVLAVADREIDDPEADPYERLRFLGLVAFYDPPREDVAPAIARCQNAGIRVIMATGDHRATAHHVALEVGLRRTDEGELRVMEGKELPAPDQTGDGDVDEMADVDVFARVDPAQKLRLIDLQQARGEILAMTGDGVNDAPALRRADIGVAMGQRGTDIAREASDMILLDDAFATIVSAVELGRTIFDNTRKFVVYLLSGNVGEILLVGGATAAGLPLPLLPLQILYLNLVNDVFPALALGIGPGNPDIMERPPRDPREGIVGRRQWIDIAAYGVVIAIVVLGVFVLALEGLGSSEAQAVTVSFLGVSTGRLVHVFNMRDRGAHPLRNEITRNKALWGALGLCLALLTMAVLVGPLASILQLVVPGPTELGLVAVIAVATLLLGQLWLVFRTRLAR